MDKKLIIILFSSVLIFSESFAAQYNSVKNIFKDGEKSHGKTASNIKLEHIKLLEDQKILSFYKEAFEEGDFNGFIYILWDDSQKDMIESIKKYIDEFSYDKNFIYYQFIVSFSITVTGKEIIKGKLISIKPGRKGFTGGQ